MMLCMCNVIPKANTERPKQKDRVEKKRLQINQNRIFKKMFNLQGVREKDNREPKQRGQIEKNKIKWQT